MLGETALELGTALQGEGHDGEVIKAANFPAQTFVDALPAR